MSESGGRAQTVLTAAVAAGVGGAWLCCVEIVLIASRGGVDGALLPWLFCAALSFTAAAAVALVLIEAPLLLWSGVGRGLAAVRRRRWLRWGLGGALLVGATVTYWVNATYYLRLYLSIHMMLSAASLVGAQLGFLILLPPVNAAPSAALGRRSLVIAAGIGVGWAAMFSVSLYATVERPVLRMTAIDRTTLLAHELIVLDGITGILAPPEVEAVGVDPSLVEEGMPMPVMSPAGVARGANVLLITVDAWRADREGPDSPVALPNMTRLAQEGVAFTRAYSPSCWTVHSMWSVLTSQFSSDLEYTFMSSSKNLVLTAHDADSELVTQPFNATKVVPLPHDNQRPNLTRFLRAAGYETATSAAALFYMRQAGITRDFEHFDDTVYREHNIEPEGITSAPLTDKGLFFLERRDRDKPFFLWLHYMDPHAPYIAHDAGTRGASAVARYHDELRLVDEQLGRLLDALRADGTLDRTIVIVHADHGEEFGDHGGRFHATTVYDETVNVPLVMRLPPALLPEPGRRIDVPVSLLDITPTVLDLVGVDTRIPLRGRTLWPMLRGEPPEPRPIIAECFRFGRKKRALVLGHHKLITDERVGTLELYDLSSDPHERHNLVESNPTVFRHLWSLMRAVTVPP